jgi:hypothetical protein
MGRISRIVVVAAGNARAGFFGAQCWFPGAPGQAIGIGHMAAMAAVARRGAPLDAPCDSVQHEAANDSEAAMNNPADPPLLAAGIDGGA